MKPGEHILTIGAISKILGKLFEMGYHETDIEKQSPISDDDASSPTSLIQHHGKLMTEDGAVPAKTFGQGDSCK